PFYGARNMVLCISGGFDRGRALRAVKRAMGALAPGREARVVAPVDRDDGPRLNCAPSDSSQSQLQLCFSGSALAERDPDYPALLMLQRIIDDGMSARL